MCRPRTVNIVVQFTIELGRVVAAHDPPGVMVVKEISRTDVVRGAIVG